MQISTSLDEILATEKLIGEELRRILQSFKQEKMKVGFSFGALCIIHYEEYTKSFNLDIYKVAAAIELLILSFDIIDDLQDKDTEYIWMKTPTLSLNAVLAMITIATKLMRECTLEYRDLAIQIVEKFVLLSINGQQQDLLNTCKEESSYLQMIEQKSGSLTSMSCLVGTVLATGEESAQIEQYANSIGVIQQIQNDINDLTEWNKKNDLLNKKYSLPIIYLFSTKNDTSRQLEKYYNSDGVTILDKSVFEEALGSSSGAIRYANAIKNVYTIKTLSIIQNMPMCEKRKNYLITLMK